MNKLEIEKSKAHTTVDLIKYTSDAKEIQPILINPAINICAISFDGNKESIEKTSPFDTFIQIIDGQVELVISGVSYILSKGQSIVIPGQATHSFIPNGQFKMIQTIIENGYE